MSSMLSLKFQKYLILKLRKPIRYYLIYVSVQEFLIPTGRKLQILSCSCHGYGQIGFISGHRFQTSAYLPYELLKIVNVFLCIQIMYYILRQLCLFQNIVLIFYAITSSHTRTFTNSDTYIFLSFCVLGFQLFVSIMSEMKSCWEVV